MNKKIFFLTTIATIILSAILLAIPTINNEVLPATLPITTQNKNLPSLAPMLEKILPAVVNIYVYGTHIQNHQLPEELRFFFGPNIQQQQNAKPFEGIGSGVIINAKKGYILTNNHVVENADKIQIQLNDGREINAKLIGKDQQTDIALLKILNNKDIKNLTSINIADSDKLRIGDFVIAIGNPFGLGQTATSGIISALSRSGLNIEGLENFIQTDASINRGNSGGALVDLNGELIGINTAILAPGGGNIGIGFAIPSNMAKNLSEQLIKYGEVKRGILGIRGTEMNSDIAKAFNINTQRGAFVSEVIPKSSAAKAGIKSGDVLVSIDGKPINKFAELKAKIGTTQIGKELKIGLIRFGKLMEVKVIIETNDEKSIKAEKINENFLGATISNSVINNTKGIRVDEVISKSPAYSMGLIKGDLIFGVNDIRVENIEQFQKILESKQPILAIKILRDNEVLYLLIKN